MEKFQELGELAKKKIHLADHILTQTYPLIQDPKLLLVVVENIFLALTNAMGAILYYERLFKSIPPFQDNFSSKFNMFREKIVNRYNIPKEEVKLIQEIKDIILQHKKSPVEFIKKNQLVICSGDYNMRTISIDIMKNYLNQAKNFVQKSNEIVSKNEAIFNKKYT